MAKKKRKGKKKKPEAPPWRFRPAKPQAISVALVGNGPSGAGMGAEIDSKDCVVRCNCWPDDGRGSRTDVWVFFGAARLGLKCPVDAKKAWFPMAPGARKKYPIYQKHMAEICAPRKLTTIETPHFRLLNKLMGKHPSTGLLAFSMILWQMHPKTITLYGFDAMTRALPGWGHQGQVSWQGGHNFAKEKLALSVFQRSHKWLGAKIATEVIWPHRPEGLK